MLFLNDPLVLVIVCNPHKGVFTGYREGFPLSAQRDRMRESCPCNVDFLLLKLARSTMQYIIATVRGRIAPTGKKIDQNI